MTSKVKQAKRFIWKFDSPLAWSRELVPWLARRQAVPAHPVAHAAAAVDAAAASFVVVAEKTSPPISANSTPPQWRAVASVCNKDAVTYCILTLNKALYCAL